MRFVSSIFIFKEIKSWNHQQVIFVLIFFFSPPQKTHQQAGPQQNCNKKNIRRVFCCHVMSRWRPVVGDGWFQMFSGVVHSQEPRWWQLKYFSIFTPKLGEDFLQFDLHIFFQMGCFNHQSGTAKSYMYLVPLATCRCLGLLPWVSTRLVMSQWWVNEQPRIAIFP